MTDQILFAALDVSLETTAICIVDADGAIRREISVQTEPEAIAVILEPDRGQMARIGLEGGPLSEWLSDGLARLGFNVVLMETRQVRAALSAMVVKTDARTRAAWRNCCGRGGSGRCMSKPRTPANNGRCFRRARPSSLG